MPYKRKEEKVQYWLDPSDPIEGPALLILKRYKAQGHSVRSINTHALLQADKVELKFPSTIQKVASEIKELRKQVSELNEGQIELGQLVLKALSGMDLTGYVNQQTGQTLESALGGLLDKKTLEQIASTTLVGTWNPEDD